MKGNFNGKIIDPERILGFLKSEKKVVAGAGDHHSAFAGDADIFYPRQRSNPVHLYTILI